MPIPPRDNFWIETAGDHGGADHGGSGPATKAIHVWAQTYLLEHRGPNVFRDAVDDYVNFLPGDEFIRGVLKVLRPRTAIERCIELCAPDRDREVRAMAAGLLATIATGLDVEVATRLIADVDPGVSASAGRLIENLVWHSMIDPLHAEKLAKLVERSRASDAQSAANEIRSAIAYVVSESESETPKPES